MEKSSPMLRGVHGLALAADGMKAMLDFYVGELGMPLVHAGIRLGVCCKPSEGDKQRVIDQLMQPCKGAHPSATTLYADARWNRGNDAYACLRLEFRRRWRSPW